MNANRRKRLEKAASLIDEAESIVEEVQQEEQDAYDNMTESRQQEEGEPAAPEP